MITDAIRDEKVLKFKVDYNDVRPQFKAIETEQDEKKLSAAENRQALLHPDRIREITQYILNNFRQKTHRLHAGNRGFNAMFAVSSVDAAKLYYECFREQQKNSDKPLRVATIFSFAANEEQDAIGDIQDESFDVSAMNSSAKEFLSAAIADYNALFKTNFSVDSNGFQNYYRDLARQVKAKEIDLLIVVGMFLTGFDAPTLNTLFVDKNLRFHGLMQAYSRTNRIFDATKTFGNIVTFRDLEQATIDAITLFGDKNTKNVVLEKSYKEYMEGFTDAATGEARRGFMEVVQELEARFALLLPLGKGEESIYHAGLVTDLVQVGLVDEVHQQAFFGAVAQACADHAPHLIHQFRLALDLLVVLEDQFQDVVQVDLLRFQQVHLKHHVIPVDGGLLFLGPCLLPAQPVAHIVVGGAVVLNLPLGRERDGLQRGQVFITQVVLGLERLHCGRVGQIDALQGLQTGKFVIVLQHVLHAQVFAEQLDEGLLVGLLLNGRRVGEAQELISDESLNAEAARRYITTSLKREFASENGTELNAVLPKMSPLNPQFLTMKQTVFQKIAAFVEKFKGVGGKI